MDFTPYVPEHEPEDPVDIEESLHSAAKEGKLQLFKVLLSRQQALSHITQKDLEQHLQTAANHGHIEIMTYLMDEGVNLPYYFPIIVANHWHADDKTRIIPILQICLDRGWEVNTIYATTGTVLLKAIRKENVPLIEFLILNGADVNMTQLRVNSKKGRFLGTPCSFRPLDTAASCCSIETIKLLLRHGARIGDCNALHRLPTLEDPENFIRILDFLLEQGMDINAIERVDPASGVFDGFPVGTPLHYAAKWGDFIAVKALLERGADPKIRSTGDYGNALDWALNECSDVPDLQVVAILEQSLGSHGDEK